MKSAAQHIKGLAISLERQFDAPCPEVSIVSTVFFGIHSADTARRKANEGELPIPAFKVGNGNKASWHINVEDLAELIFNRWQEARKDYKNLHSGYITK